MENIDINRFGSSFTLMNANDGNLIVNTTNSLTDFYILWNQTNHQLHPSGLSLPNVLRTLRTLTEAQLEAERTTSSLGGQSKIGLIIPQQAAVNEADSNFAMQQIWQLRETVPDLTLLFLTGGTPGRFGRFVREESRDIFPIQVTGSINDNVAALVNPLIQRIEQCMFLFLRKNVNSFFV